MIKLFPKDKAGLNKIGHRIWAGMLLIIVIFLIDYYNIYPIYDLLLNQWLFSSALIIVYIFSSSLVDRLEPSYSYKIFKGSHRKFLHSWTWSRLIVIILIPLSLWLFYAYSKYWLFLTAILVSNLVHILGDFLSGRIPK